MVSEPRIVISQRTTLATLIAHVRARGGQPFTIVGTGARARRLLDKLASEVPDLRIARFGREYMAVVGDHNPPAVILPR